MGAPYGSDGTEPFRDGRNLPRTLANQPLLRWGLWSPAAGANTATLPQIQAQQWEAAVLLSGPGRRRRWQGEGAGRAADWSRCLRACRAALPLCALPSCLETRSRARELGQLSVGISEPWWVPGLHWGCQELLLGKKGRGARSGSGASRRSPHQHGADAQGGSASPSSSLECHGGSVAPRGSGFPWASSFHQDDFPLEREASRCLRHCFLFIPAVEINPVSSEPGERHELISYIWW